MSSGFGGGAPEFYSVSGGFPPRSTTTTSQGQPYRSHQQQFPGVFLDPSASQIAQQSDTPPPLSLSGKRTISEFQPAPAFNSLLRSVRPRSYLQRSPLDFSGALSYQRYGNGILMPQQLTRPPSVMNLVNGAINLPSNPIPASSPMWSRTEETETKLKNRLQELEKALLDDDETGDDVSAVTNSNSEWSEAMQSLFSPAQNPITSSSPTSSSSPSSSVSVPFPAFAISKQSLVEAATAIYEGRNDAAAEILNRFSTASQQGGNSEQRLLEHVLSALKSRVFPAENASPATELSSRDHALSIQMLYDLSPCFKLGFMAANSAILEAAAEHPVAERLHVVDFDIGKGKQYFNLLHALSTRLPGSRRPSVVKITAVSDDASGEDVLREIGDQLTQAAAKAGVGFEFAVVTQRPSELTRESLGCSLDEALAVNFAFKLHLIPDESVTVENPRDELLRRAKSLQPRVVTLVEHEMNANTAPLAARVNEAFGYYGALLESIESTVAASEGSDWSRLVEEGLSRRLANSLGCEGLNRVERCEVFGKWRARMGMAGFGPRAVSTQTVEWLRSRLSTGKRNNPGFTVKEECGGGVGLGWLGRNLTVASAWR
ncbi:hypothetical protein SAY87_024295 [Trapa incisa]|uniref:Scarecrow-like protein 8 n=1 Tax=Trapa incisa TaxID=236973 RepID=A0AAN7JFC6_9MYRT|nr:hypothetical protein SAY87_024295 [Trapa incisa]